MMSKNIVVCCDGTGNEVEGNLSNVLKLFRITQKNADQRVYYTPGIGTIGSRDPWSRLKQNTKAVFGLATGYGLDNDILGAYRFLCDHYEKDDDIFLFGFSRGAYTVRALGGFIHMVGLLPVAQLNIANYALSSYKRASEDDNLSIAWNFSRIAGGRRVTIKFIGVWDTVATVIVPRRDRLIPMLQTLPYTRKNPSVQVFRHAMSIDERRRMFRLNRWTVPQPFVANPFDKAGIPQEQAIKQAWFAGVHADVGGGYPEAQSGLSKFPLDWMIEEAKAHGLKINVAMRNHIVRGHPREGGRNVYVKPDPAGKLHKSLTWQWRPLEWIPKSTKWQEWKRWRLLGCYIPNGEPRKIEDPIQTPIIHESVRERMTTIPAYKPVNFPTSYNVEPSAMAKAAANRAATDRFVATVLPIIDRMKASGTIDAAAIAAQLNERNLRTARDGPWYPQTVLSLLKRAAAARANPQGNPFEAADSENLYVASQTAKTSSSITSNIKV
jgi:uncharacterized protein (DUF2235 family)